MMCSGADEPVSSVDGALAEAALTGKLQIRLLHLLVNDESMNLCTDNGSCHVWILRTVWGCI
jgi:hypothetical protein